MKCQSINSPSWPSRTASRLQLASRGENCRFCPETSLAKTGESRLAIAPPAIPDDGWKKSDDANSYVDNERDSKAKPGRTIFRWEAERKS